MLVNIDNLSFAYGVKDIFINLNLIINEKERIGLVGPNGCGKSTLIKILCEELSFDRGAFIKKQGLRIGYLAQEDAFNPEDTINDILMSSFAHLIEIEKQLGVLSHEVSLTTGYKQEKSLKKLGELQEFFAESKGYEYPSRVRGIAKGLGFSEDDCNKPYRLLSGGEKTRVALGCVLLKDSELLLLDEPTNYLDIDSLLWLEQYLKALDGGFLLVSHDRYFMDKVCTGIFEVSNHQIDVYSGNYTQYIAKKEKLSMERDHQYAIQMREINRQKELIARFRSYNSKHSSKRAASREKALEKITLLDRTPKDPTLHFSFKPQIQSGKDVLSVDNLSKSFGNRMLFENVSFDVHRGEKIGIIGANGIGKTTLFQIIKNTASKDSGTVSFGTKVFLGYFDQQNMDLKAFSSDNLLEALWDIDSRLTEGELRNILAAFLFTGDSVFKKIGDLSGGEKSRLSLARLMLSKSNLLLMDEPTNHLDMRTKEILENALIPYQGTLIYISHDRYFLNKISTKIIELTPKGVQISLGNYDDYLFHKEEENIRLNDSIQKIEITKTKQKQAQRKSKAEEALKRQRKKNLKMLEAKIEASDEAIEDFEKNMCDAGFYDNPEAAAKITADYHREVSNNEKYLEEWELLLEELENDI